MMMMMMGMRSESNLRNFNCLPLPDYTLDASENVCTAALHRCDFLVTRALMETPGCD